MLEYDPTEKDVIETREEADISIEARQETEHAPEPCPICGKKDAVGVFVYSNGISFFPHVECLNCFLRIGTGKHYPDEKTARREATKNWNEKVRRLR